MKPIHAHGPYDADFQEWCVDHSRFPDRAALRDYMGWKFPVRYPDK